MLAWPDYRLLLTLTFLCLWPASLWYVLDDVSVSSCLVWRFSHCMFHRIRLVYFWHVGNVIETDNIHSEVIYWELILILSISHTSTTFFACLSLYRTSALLSFRISCACHANTKMNEINVFNIFMLKVPMLSFRKANKIGILIIFHRYLKNAVYRFDTGICAIWGSFIELYSRRVLNL